MAEGHMIKGYKIHESPVLGKLNKFVITEDQAWFLAMEDKAQLPFREILPEIFDFSNEEAMDLVEAKLEDGQILLGYVTKETGEVEVHTWPLDRDSGSETVKRRMREIFPHAEYFEAADRERYQL